MHVLPEVLYFVRRYDMIHRPTRAYLFPYLRTSVQFVCTKVRKYFEVPSYLITKRLSSIVYTHPYSTCTVCTCTSGRPCRATFVTRTHVDARDTSYLHHDLTTESTAQQLAFCFIRSVGNARDSQLQLRR